MGEAQGGMVVFFFQAEDGIRDGHVTGVQTCALPIYALIQEAAYQSLLRTTRQQYHRRIVTVLAERFPQIGELSPELVAHHYSEANLAAEAIPYWRRAGENAVRRSAYR